MKILKALFFCLSFLIVSIPILSQNVCNVEGNLIIYSNLKGGNLTINITENVPDIHIGICSKEPVVINITGIYASNVKKVVYAGSDTLISNECLVSTDTTVAFGVNPEFFTKFILPNATFINPFGNTQIVGAYGNCSSNTFAEDMNTPDQIVSYFVEKTGAVLRYHHTQLGCWEGEFKMIQGGNCCLTSDPNGVVEAVFEVDQNEVCVGSCVNFRNFSLGGPFNVVSWYFEGGTPSFSSEFEPTICYDTPGVYAVSLLVSRNNFSNVMSVPGYIKVVEAVDPVAEFSYSTPICLGSPVQLPNTANNFTTGGIFSANNGLVIDPNSGQFDPSTAENGSYTITYTYPFEQCMTSGSNVHSFNFDVVNIPIINTTPSGVVVYCIGSSLNLTAESGYLDYQWNTSNGNQQTISVNQSGNYFVTANSSSGCSATSSVITVLAVQPEEFNITPSGNVSFCENDSVVITATPGFQNYNWSNGFSGQQQVTYASGFFTVSVFDQNNCLIERSVSISEIKRPISSFSHGQTQSLTIDFLNSSQFGNSHLWNFGDGQFSVDFSPSHVYLDNGIFNINLVASNECGSDTSSQSIDVLNLGVDGLSDNEMNWGINNSMFWFSYRRDLPDLNVRLYSIDGRLINQKKISSIANHQSEIYIENLSKGVYFVHLEHAQYRRAIKFIKN